MKPQYRFKKIVLENGKPAIHMEMMPQPPPTPEKYQRKARIRRLHQQLRDGVINTFEITEALKCVNKDYAGWRK